MPDNLVFELTLIMLQGQLLFTVSPDHDLYAVATAYYFKKVGKSQGNFQDLSMPEMVETQMHGIMWLLPKLPSYLSGLRRQTFWWRETKFDSSTR